MIHRPIPDSYWVDCPQRRVRSVASEQTPGQLVAGEYPGAKDPDEARRKVERFVAAGVTRFIDLTEHGEYGLRPYVPMLVAAAAARDQQVMHTRMPIPDRSTTSREHMASILDAIDDALDRGDTVYVHCYGGIGRTGTVVGCWLVRHGKTGEQALSSIEAWRLGTPDENQRSPETDAQRAMVLAWSE